MSNCPFLFRHVLQLHDEDDFRIFLNLMRIQLDGNKCLEDARLNKRYWSRLSVDTGNTRHNRCRFTHWEYRSMIVLELILALTPCGGPIFFTNLRNRYRIPGMKRLTDKKAARHHAGVSCSMTDEVFSLSGRTPCSVLKRWLAKYPMYCQSLFSNYFFYVSKHVSTRR
ncbi:unnamed protein product [Amoebophrya sp. A120]|nr:unnamed protein product [Amoebophrya sp. A120]|eukprot:GSA120T00024074001.1